MKQFWKDTLERAIKTAAQSALAMLGTHALVESVNWITVASVVVMATVCSLLTSVASYNAGDVGTASLVNRDEERR